MKSRFFVSLLGCAALLALPLSALAETTLAVTPAVKKIPAKGTLTGKVTVKVVYSDQATVDVSLSAPEWVTLAESSKTVTIVKGKGTATFAYTVAAYGSSVNRSGEFSASAADAAAAATGSITQTGLPCKVKLEPGTQPKKAFAFTGGTGDFSFSAPEGCPWQVTVAGEEWLTVGQEAFSGEGAGTVSFSAVVNEAKKPRTGKIVVATTDPNTEKPTGKLTFTVTEAGYTGAGKTKIGAPTNFTDTAGALKAVSAVTLIGQTLSSGSGIGDIIGGIALSAGASKTVSKAAVLAGKAVSYEPIACSSGSSESNVDLSSVIATGDPTSLLPVFLQGNAIWVQFTDCVEPDSSAVLNGRVSLKIVPNINQATQEIGGSVTVTIGSASAPFTMVGAEGKASVGLTFTASSADVSDLGSILGGGSTTDGALKISANGTASFEDTVEGVKETVDMKNFSLNMATAVSSGSDITVTANGAFLNTVISNGTLVASQDLAFDDLSVQMVETEFSSTATIDGKFALNFYPAAECINGTFDVDTTTPLVVGETGVTGGAITVNNAALTFNADGTVNVTVDGLTPALNQAVPEGCSTGTEPIIFPVVASAQPVSVFF